LGGACLIGGALILSRSAFLGAVVIVIGLLVIPASIFGDPWGVAGPSVLGVWYMNGRLGIGSSEATIYSLGLAAGYNSRYRIKEMEFGDRGVRFKVVRRGIPHRYNLRFTPEEFERFRKAADNWKPSILSWEFG